MYDRVSMHGDSEFMMKLFNFCMHNFMPMMRSYTCTPPAASLHEPNDGEREYMKHCEHWRLGDMAMHHHERITFVHEHQLFCLSPYVHVLYTDYYVPDSV